MFKILGFLIQIIVFCQLVASQRIQEYVQGQGLCQASQDCACSYMLRPICGSDGVTYTNQCFMACARQCNPSLIKRFEGMCPERYDHQERVERPQKASLPMKAKVKGVRKEIQYYFYKKNGHNNQIKSSCNANGEYCRCPKRWIPFCGSDLVTYRNLCEIDCAQRYCDPDLEIKYEGVCYVHDEYYNRMKALEKNRRVSTSPPYIPPRVYETTTRRRLLPKPSTTPIPIVEYETTREYFPQESDHEIRIQTTREQPTTTPSTYTSTSASTTQSPTSTTTPKTIDIDEYYDLTDELSSS